MLDINDRRMRRALWRQLEKVGRRAGESLEYMNDLGDCECGGLVCALPPSMSYAFLTAMGETPVAAPSCGDRVVWLAPDGRRPLACDRCHGFFNDLDLHSSAEA